MKSVGRLLREKRERLNRTVAKCAKETKISKRFIVGIEEENLEIFPGEAYFLGFLKIYAKYLGFNGEEIASQYKRQQKVEQPIPLEELTKPFRKKKKSYTVLISSIAIMAILCIILIYVLLFRNPTDNKQIVDNKNEVEDVKKNDIEEKEINKDFELYYKFRTSKEYKDFYVDDGFSFVIDGNNDLNFLIKEIDNIENKVLIYFFETQEELKLSIDESVYFDFNKDGENDFIIKVNSIDSILRKANIGLVKDTNVLPSNVSQFANYQLSENMENLKVINIDIETSGAAYMKYIADSSSEEEKLLRRRENVRITAQNEIELHLTNIQNMVLKINGKQQKLPNGFVSFIYIKWILNEESGNYELDVEYKE